MLADYDLRLFHTPGKQMTQSDALSRRPDLCPDDDNDNEDRILLSESLFVNAVDLDLHDLIVSAYHDDPLADQTATILNFPSALPPNSKPEDWILEDGLLFYKGRCYVPDNGELRRRITERFHDSLAAGHPGQLRTQQLLQEHYWWPGLPSLYEIL